MKRFSPPRVTTSNTLTQGIDNALAVAVLFGIGFALDHWLGTDPLFMIVLTMLGGVGVFAKVKYRYDEEMAAHEAERRTKASAGRVTE
jgi:F0F1-type ATP synthase assembly protein I